MIDALKQGDVATFKQVYTQYADKVYFYFKKKTASDEDARDLLQTTFLKLWQYRSSMCTDYLAEQHLFHIAKTVFIDYLRKQNKYAQLQKKSRAQTGDMYSINPAACYFITSQLQSVLSAMPAIRRKVFELNRLQGYSYKEVAELLSISTKAVDNNLTKALKQLRKQFVFILLFIVCHYK